MEKPNIRINRKDYSKIIPTGYTIFYRKESIIIASKNPELIAKDVARIVLNKWNESSKEFQENYHQESRKMREEFIKEDERLKNRKSSRPKKDKSRVKAKKKKNRKNVDSDEDD